MPFMRILTIAIVACLMVGVAAGQSLSCSATSVPTTVIPSTSPSSVSAIGDIDLDCPVTAGSVDLNAGFSLIFSSSRVSFGPGGPLMVFDGSSIAGFRGSTNNVLFWYPIVIAQAGFSGSKHFRFTNITANVPPSLPQILVQITISYSGPGGSLTLAPLPVANIVSPIVVTTNPSGLTVTVDTQTYTSPQTFQWNPGMVSRV